MTCSLLLVPADVGVMLDQRRRRWANIIPTPAEYFVFVAISLPGNDNAYAKMLYCWANMAPTLGW